MNLSITRAPVARLVIFERPVLFGLPVAADERPSPPADGSPEAVEAAARLAHGGCHLAIASQHPAVARGLLDMTALNGLNRRLLRQFDEAGARIEAIAICPHGPEARCACRMPLPGMLTELIGRFGATPNATAVIASSREAVEAGLAAGCRTLWVGAEDEPATVTGQGPLRVATLADAVTRLLARPSADIAGSADAAGPVATRGAAGADGSGTKAADTDSGLPDTGTDAGTSTGADR